MALRLYPKGKKWRTNNKDFVKYYDCFQIIFGEIEYKNENDRDYAEYIGNEMQVLI